MIKNRRNRRRGISLVELAFALLIIGAVLGVVWQRAGDIYRNMAVAEAGAELQAVAQYVRGAHPYDLIAANEPWGDLILTPELTGIYKGDKVVYDPWRGYVTVFPGNAMGWGRDTYDQEFTIRFDGLPSDACEEMVLRNAAAAARDSKLIAVYISPGPAEGKEICFASDAFCRNPVADIGQSLIHGLCSQRRSMTVMFTYPAHS